MTVKKKTKKIKRATPTFEREMQDANFKEKFDAEYEKFLLSEAILKLMDEQGKSVRKLAAEIGISPSVIQDIRSGTRTNVTLKNVSKIVQALGSEVAVKIGNKYFQIG
ncbi:helix-turn-helix transcriptional regulator [bacterium]|nr:helix-turn-helix transcriptional regulator [bacterium]